jgi:hypothetical protein
MLRAIVFPLTDASVFVPLLVFWLLLMIAIWAGLYGLWLLVLVIPAVIRFQMIVLEALGRGVTPATPDIGFFNWFGNAWTLFPAPLVVLLVWCTTLVAESFGTAPAILPVLFASVFFPASIAVLAITQSPLQSLNPAAIVNLLTQCGRTLWIASLYLLLLSWLSVEARTLPDAIACFLWLLYGFSFVSLLGAIIEPYGLFAQVSIPEPVEKTADVSAAELVNDRTRVLNHAYGFISRDNRAGGFRHIFDWIRTDPEPHAAWAWFFNRMLAWESQAPALFFAQHYLHEQLQHGETVAAVKLIMRCRMIDEGFRPLEEDRAAAIAAAEAVSNDDLVVHLRRI